MLQEITKGVVALRGTISSGPRRTAHVAVWNALSACGALLCLLGLLIATRGIAAQPAQAQGQRYALVIGIGQYKHYGQVKFGRQDALDFASALAERAGFDRDRLCLVTDGPPPEGWVWSEADFVDLSDRIEQFTSLPKPGDVLLVFFTGHGVTIGNEAYLMPANGRTEKTAISMSSLRQRMADCKATTKVLILDACHSGEAIYGVLGITTSAAQGAATLVLTSCGDKEVSYPDEKEGHGVFTAGLLKGLSGAADANEDGDITGEELFRCAQSHVEKWCIRNEKMQTPQMFPEEAAGLVVARIPPARALYEKVMAEGERLMAAQDLAGAAAAFRRALAVEGYGADARALAGLATAQGGAEALGKRQAYEAALAQAQGAYGRARGGEDEASWQQVKRLAEQAIGTGHMDVSAARALLDQADRHLLPAAPEWAKLSQEQIAAAKRLGLLVAQDLDLGGGVTMRLVLIPPGDFMMGSPANEAERFDDEGPQHRIRITKAFYMGIHEVTQAQYEQVVGGNPAHFQGRDKPVEQVSWKDAQEFCRRLSRRTGQTVRLPTEAEWEYACRAGTTTRFSFGDSEDELGNYAWYTDNSGGQTHPVAQKRPNAWGLYDMHGNVREWCQDWYGEDYYRTTATDDPQGPATGEFRVLLGGSWYPEPWGCRSAARGRLGPEYRDCDFGFRVVLSPRP